MKKIDAAQLAVILAGMGIEVSPEASANATVAPTAVTRKVAKPATVTPPASYRIKASKYKGHDVVSFESDTARPFALGFTKLRIVLAHADALRKLVG